MKEGMQIVNIQNPEWGTFTVPHREVETMWAIRGRDLRNLRGQRCEECNDLIVWHSRGGTCEPFKTCVNRKCSEYMLTATTLASEFTIQDDGSGNQVLADGRVLR